MILLFCVLGLNAQLSFGIRGGINSSNVNLKDFSGDYYQIDYARGALGFHIGGMAQIKLMSVFIQPELLFTSIKNDISVASFDDVAFSWREPDFGEQRFNKIDIPVIAGVKLGPLKLQAGPVATMIISSKIKDLDAYDINQEFSGATIGYQAGVGLELANLLVDVKYEGNLSKLGDGVKIAGSSYSFDTRMSQWILSVGFLFGR